MIQLANSIGGGGSVAGVSRLGQSVWVLCCRCLAPAAPPQPDRCRGRARNPHGPQAAFPSGGSARGSARSECVADLQYRDAFEFAVGHGVATRAALDPEGECRVVHTCWVPTAEVERGAAAAIDGVELGMEALAELTDGVGGGQELGPLVTEYRGWIDTQKTKIQVKHARSKETAGRCCNGPKARPSISRPALPCSMIPRYSMPSALPIVSWRPLPAVGSARCKARTRPSWTRRAGVRSSWRSSS